MIKKAIRPFWLCNVLYLAFLFELYSSIKKAIKLIMVSQHQKLGQVLNMEVGPIGSKSNT